MVSSLATEIRRLGFGPVNFGGLGLTVKNKSLFSVATIILILYF
jgi:hypothetical protein